MIFRNALKEKQYQSIKQINYQSNNLPNKNEADTCYQDRKDYEKKCNERLDNESTFDMINCSNEMYEKQDQVFLENQSSESHHNELIYNESSDEEDFLENSTKDDIDEFAEYGLNLDFNETDDCKFEE